MNKANLAVAVLVLTANDFAIAFWMHRDAIATARATILQTAEEARGAAPTASPSDGSSNTSTDAPDVVNNDFTIHGGVKAGPDGGGVWVTTTHYKCSPPFIVDQAGKRHMKFGCADAGAP
jgi:hypothetical protein